jgi:hypothetical protein
MKQVVTFAHTGRTVQHPQQSKRNTASPLVENNFSLLAGNRSMDGNNDNNLLVLPATTKGSDTDDGDGFKQYLLAHGKRNLKQILLNAAKYGNILKTGDASEILTFPNTKRHHVMEALVCLSKYQGTYNIWKEIKVPVKMDVT